ncbi:MAG: peptide chain release factor N(5)-glutamine methyltransferase [Planctomycetes bacterium]|nr:peptide chain release factor N(5)-glutamine methyltransferase [Planctomycetota bacterium]
MAEDEKAWQPLELVKVSADYLATKDVPNPRLDAEVLLCNIMGLRRRVDLYAGFENKISGKELAAYRELIRRRAAREPVSRILGRREFMGIDFIVTPDVLSPRPETELLVEEALAILSPRRQSEPEPEADGVEPVLAEAVVPAGGGAPDVDIQLAELLDSYAEDIDDEAEVDREDNAPSPKKPVAPPPAATVAAAASAEQANPAAPRGRKDAVASGPDAPVRKVLDLGTGSGCIAVSIAAKLPNARVLAVDASPKAIAVARKNAAAAGVDARIAFRQGDWLAACKPGERFDIILSNPPYLVEGDPEIWPEVSGYDPAAALYAGRDGLDCYRRILPDAAEYLMPGGWIVFEVGAGQAGPVGDLLKRFGFGDIGTVRDYGGVDRIVKGRRLD